MFHVVLAAVALCRACIKEGSYDQLALARKVLLSAVHDYCDYQPPTVEPQPQPMGVNYISVYALHHLRSGNKLCFELLTSQEKALANEGRKIEAIKSVRERTSLGLAEAKVCVEFYQGTRYSETAY